MSLKELTKTFYDDIKLKQTPLVSYTEIIQLCKG